MSKGKRYRIRRTQVANWIWLIAMAETDALPEVSEYHRPDIVEQLRRQTRSAPELEAVARVVLDDNGGDPVAGVRSLPPYWLYGEEVRPTPEEVLEANMAHRQRGTRQQVFYLASLCRQRGITESMLIQLGVDQDRLHRARQSVADAGGSLEELTRPEVGGLFAFQEWLEAG